MENLTKYVMGVAAKSNVEKRQVGCVITLDGNIVAEGYNTEENATYGELDEHAEVAACRDMRANSLDIDSGIEYVAHVTHQPCPACSKQLLEYGVTKIEVVDAFMKFDTDKVRFDLIDPQFAILALQFKGWKTSAKRDEVKAALYRWSIQGDSNAEDWGALLALVLGSYTDFYQMEEALAKVLTFGASKYKPGNWKQCSDTGRYLAAAHRHLNAVSPTDEETGLPHNDHMLCNLMFLYHLGLK